MPETHEHRMDQVFMGGRDKPGHDEFSDLGGATYMGLK